MLKILVLTESGLTSVGASNSSTLTLLFVLRQCKNFNYFPLINKFCIPLLFVFFVLTTEIGPGIFGVEQDLREEVKLSGGLEGK